ncbi:MAG: 30S ribosomal protein S21 [Candidatus Delongbacteria bacterium]
MIHIKVRDGEHFEKALKRFTKTFEKSGILAELRNRERYDKPTWVNRREKVQAIRKQQRIQRLQNKGF